VSIIGKEEYLVNKLISNN